MNKIEKKKTKLKERIKYLENELLLSLTQKSSTTKEINVGEYQRKIQDLNIELKNFK